VQETDRQIERGLSFHRAGNVQAAAQIYSQVLEQNPDQADALYLMGCLAHQAGDSAAAVGLLQKAILVRPGSADCYYALGNALARVGKDESAEGNLRRAVELGTRAEFHISLGLLLKKLHRLTEAVVEFETAVRIAPKDEDAHANLAQAHYAAGDLSKAIAGFEKALELDASRPAPLAALRQALIAAERNEEAHAHLHRAVAAVGANAHGLCDLADALQQAGDLGGAIDVYHHALLLDARLLRAWYACGCAEIEREDFASALVCFDQAIARKPDSVEARHNRARSLYELGQVRQAYEEFKICAARSEASASLARAMLAVIAPGAPQADNKSVLEIRQAWARDLQVSDPPVPAKSVSGRGGHRLKVGYVSSFFHRDNWMKPVWGLINAHDREQFEIYLFSDAPRSAIQHGYRSHESDHFFDTTRLSNTELAELILQNDIQVLVDLNGYSDMNRLPMFLSRPAPIIAGWFNMYATTGMPCFDFLIGDRHVLPGGEEAFYSEAVHRVDGSYLTFSVDYPIPPVAPPPCLSNAEFTFGCLGSQYKITTEVVEAWSRILLASPRSRLLLKNKRLGKQAARDFMRKLFSIFGVDQDRLVFEEPADHFAFLRAYDKIDIALDTFPYNGGTTTTEAIWQGVPVITFSGDRWASRTSASILRAGGLDEFVAENLDGYISLAANLANSPHTAQRLASLRSSMREQLAASNLCDTRAFALQMEAIYRRCWKSGQS
jgi:predicted O-linked N-acetylglucosamine transferase (SPINDLY family)